MKRIRKKALMALALFTITTASFGTCLDALVYCYDHGGSEAFCSGIYYACLEAP